MTQVLPYLYISGQSHAYSLEWLQNHNIAYVINAAEEVDSKFPKLIKYLSLKLDDHKKERIERTFVRSYDFIEHARREGRSVLVHCYMGISRSATIVLYYLMRKNNMTYEDALSFLRAKREIVNPNEGFEKVLKVISEIYNN